MDENNASTTAEVNELSKDVGIAMEHDNPLSDNIVDSGLNMNLSIASTPCFKQVEMEEDNSCNLHHDISNVDELAESVNITLPKDNDFVNINDVCQEETPSACSDTQTVIENKKQYSLSNFETSIQIAGAWEDLACKNLANKFTKGCKWYSAVIIILKSMIEF
jgi:hypothetical protein